MTKRTLLVIGASALAAPSWACLNDRDTTTLADVAGKFPNAVQVITGRFPRNPPLYYEMRIQRITGKLKRNPNLLPEYDDIAVACDRIGRDDEAIAWMEGKRERMLALGKSGDAPDSGDTPWYRYYANNGTFWVHRYMHSAGKRPLSDVENARSLIQKAIEVYPGAHYGRERFQVYAMDWMLNEGTRERSNGYTQEQPLGEYMVERGFSETERPSGTNRIAATVDGIAGIIVLGAGWESVDMFDALSFAFRYHHVRGAPIGQLATMRVSELLRAGKRSAWPGHPLLHFTVVPPAPAATSTYWSVESNYVRLRKEAEEWQAKRTAYMVVRLQAGRHPDTDPAFWAEYKDAPAPPIYNAPWYVRAWWGLENLGFFAWLIGATVLPTALFIRSRWIASRTGRPSTFSWGTLFALLAFVWLVALILFPVFAKARV
ncbi:MAG TPA: hypothetical protein VGM51_04500 [Armatimonadota bacterium]|jgi:hypothetical protein